MSKPEEITASGVTAGFCDEDHLHITFLDENQNPIASVAMSFEDGAKLVLDLFEQVDARIPDEDEIGPVMGSC